MRAAVTCSPTGPVFCCASHPSSPAALWPVQYHQHRKSLIPDQQHEDPAPPCPSRQGAIVCMPHTSASKAVGTDQPSQITFTHTNTLTNTSSRDTSTAERAEQDRRRHNGEGECWPGAHVAKLRLPDAALGDEGNVRRASEAQKEPLVERSLEFQRQLRVKELNRERISQALFLYM